jgi:HEAT repeat protein
MIVTAASPRSLSLLGRAFVLVLLVALPLTPVRGQNKSTASPSAAKPATQPTTVDDATRKALDALLETAVDPDQQVSQAAQAAIMRFGKQAVPVLVKAMQDSQENVAQVAQRLLVSMSDDAIDPLIQLLQSTDAATRERSLLALEEILRTNANLAPGGFGFGGTMQPGGEMGIEGGVISAVYAPGGGMAPGVPSSPHANELAKRIGPAASGALVDSAAPVRRAAARLMGYVAVLAPDSAITKAMVPLLKDGDAQVRQQAAAVLGSLGGDAFSAVDSLAAAVADSDKGVRLSALNALASMGIHAKGAMNEVAAALKDRDPQVRTFAANALGAMQPATPTPTDSAEGGAPGPVNPNNGFNLARPR